MHTGGEPSCSQAGPPHPGALVRLDAPLHHRLAEVLRAVDDYEHAIAEADLTNETLRCALSDFQRRYEAAVAPERRALTRTQLLLAHVDRQLAALRDDAPDRGRAAHLRALAQRRDHELRAWRAQARTEADGDGAAPADDPDRTNVRADARAARPRDGAPGPDAAGPGPHGPAGLADSWHVRRQASQARLKQAFRVLARRYHPDLCADDDQRARRSQLMAHVNALYGKGELARLEALAEQVEQAALAEAAAQAPQVPLAQRLEDAEARLDWFTAVLRNLYDERDALEASPTAELWEALEGGPHGTGLRPGLLQQLRRELAREAAARLADVPRAMQALEEVVLDYNRRQVPRRPTAAALARREAEALAAPRFDPRGSQSLARLGLEDLAALRVPPRLHGWAQRLVARAAKEPAFVRLILLTYVVQSAEGTMPGLETFAELEARFAASGRSDVTPQTLPEALLHADGLVEYAPQRFGVGLRCRLRFRDAAMMTVVAQALRDFGVRQLFAGLLRCLGEAIDCGQARCRRRTFAVPLFLLRGMGDVRGVVCPHCAAVQRSYVLAKGDDVHGVFGAAYLDFGLVEEFTVAFGSSQVGLQFLPQQLAGLRVADLRARLHAQLFARNEVAVAAHDCILWHDGARLSDAQKLAALPTRALRLQFSPRCALREADVLHQLRYRLQVRFSPRH